MKDLVVPGRMVIRELRLAAVCLLFALGLNAYAIVRFKTAWSELATTWPVTLGLAAAVYVLLGAGRLLVAAFRRLFRRRT